MNLCHGRVVIMELDTVYEWGSFFIQGLSKVIGF